MAYENIEELPTQVRLSLQSDDQEAWMKAYNQALDEGLSVEGAKESAWFSVKDNPSSFSFAIVASVECVDSDGEVVDVQSIKDHIDDMIERGGISQEEHGNYTISTVWAWDDYTDPDTNEPGIVVYGNLFGGDKIYEEARKEFLNGMNKMSVGGDASYAGYQCDEKGCYIRRNVEQLAEISLCYTPANPKSTLLWYNEKAVAKSKKKKDKEVRLMIKSVKAHPECPYCEIRRNIAHKGLITAKIRKNGVYVETSNPGELKSIVKKNNYHLMGDDNYYFVTSIKKATEIYFKALYKNGCIDNKGQINKKITKQMFVHLYKNDFIKQINGRYFLKNDGGITSATPGASQPSFSDKKRKVANRTKKKELNKTKVTVYAPDDAFEMDNIRDARDYINNPLNWNDGQTWVNAFKVRQASDDSGRFIDEYSYTDDDEGVSIHRTPKYDKYGEDIYEHLRDTEFYTVGELRAKYGLPTYKEIDERIKEIIKEAKDEVRQYIQSIGISREIKELSIGKLKTYLWFNSNMTDDERKIIKQSFFDKYGLTVKEEYEDEIIFDGGLKHYRPDFWKWD